MSPTTGPALVVTAHGGTDVLAVEDRPAPEPGAGEVLVEVAAAGVNFLDVYQREGVYPTKPPFVGGNEGAGTVVAAGDSDAAQALIGTVVGFAGGASYGEYRVVPAFMCMVLPDGTDPAKGASCFVNPLTALGMVETMRAEGHTGLVHTAAASNLGQMLNRICLADGVPLVNVVRRPEQAQLLRDQGATHVCDSSEPTFEDDLVAALRATKATLAFDAVGGGTLAGQILSAMERAQPPLASYTPYGSTTYKQVYIYGSLDFRPTVIDRDFGLTWGLGGFLLMVALGRLGGETFARMMARLDRPGAFWKRTDQTFLEAFFPEWQGLPVYDNLLQYVWLNLPELWDWGLVRVIHYQYEKPWDPANEKAGLLAPLVDLWRAFHDGGDIPDLAALPRPG